MLLQDENYKMPWSGLAGRLHNLKTGSSNAIFVTSATFS